MKTHNELVRDAAAEDGARALLRAAADIERFAGNFCDVSETTIRRTADQLRTVANLKRPKIEPEAVPIPGDVRGAP